MRNLAPDPGNSESFYATEISMPQTQTGREISAATILPGLIGFDVVAILLGFRLAYLLRFDLGLAWFFQHESSQIDFYRHFVFFLIPVWLIVFAIFGLYTFKNIFTGTEEYTRIFQACTLSILLIIFFSFFDREVTIARAWVILSWLSVFVTVVLARFIFRRLIYHIRQQGRFVTRALIIGANEEGLAVASQLNSSPTAGVRVVGFADNRLKTKREPHTGLTVLGRVNAVTELVQKHQVQEVIIAATALSRKQLLQLIEILHEANIPIRLSSGLYEMLTTGVEVHELGNVPLMTINKLRLTGSERFIKRLLDIAGATVGLLLLLPLLVIIGLAIKLDSAGPVFYRRRVVGVGGQPFDAFKFRTMTTDADLLLATNELLRQQFEQNFKLKDDPRITQLGHFLRRTSLDELPQLVNVLIGQMSLVGPRMITEPERAYYGQWHINLFTVKPGMTGLWQVSGRSDVSYSERVRLDMQYIRNYSIWLDLSLLGQTVPAIIKKRGAY